MGATVRQQRAIQPLVGSTGVIIAAEQYNGYCTMPAKAGQIFGVAFYRWVGRQTIEGYCYAKRV